MSATISLKHNPDSDSKIDLDLVYPINLGSKMNLKTLGKISCVWSKLEFSFNLKITFDMTAVTLIKISININFYFNTPLEYKLCSYKNVHCIRKPDPKLWVLKQFIRFSV